MLRMYGAILSFKVFLRVLDIKRGGHLIVLEVDINEKFLAVSAVPLFFLSFYHCMLFPFPLST